MVRQNRLQKIAKILAGGNVADQADLQARLKRARVAVSQASLSRDLQALGAQRVRMADGAYHYVMPEAPPLATSPGDMRRRFAESVTDVRRCQFMVLVFTPPGEAPRVGKLLDGANIPQLVGTVAGDDTVQCIAEDTRKAKSLESLLMEMRS